MTDLTSAVEQIWAGRAVADELESSRLEFKRGTEHRDDTAQMLTDAAVCFANAAGGTVVVGISDRDSGPRAFVGTDLRAAELRRRIRELTQPPLDVQITELIHHDARLLVIEVQEGLDVHSTRSRMPTRRFEAECLPMSPVDIARLDEHRRGTDWSATSSGRPVTDADPRAILQLRSLLPAAPARGMRSLEHLELSELLRALTLVDADGMLTRGGELLLCASHNGPDREVVVYQHRETLGGEADAVRRWTGPLLPAIVELLATIETRIGTTPVNLTSGQQVQIQDYPMAAVREAIVNGAMHGEHRDHRPIYVEHAPESLRVRSPGPLVAGVTPANILTHPPTPRFPSLAGALRAVGLAEELGQGVDRMFREMIRTGKRVPQVDVTSGDLAETSVTFRGGPPNARVAKFVASLPTSEQDDTDAMLVVSILVERRSISAHTVGGLLQRDLSSTEAVLRRLAGGAAQLIEPTPRSSSRRHPDYRLRADPLAALGPAVTYQSRPRADRDRKIYDHVREYQSINNATIQRLFDVDVYVARNILQELMGREVLVRTSEQTRGTAVRYGPGPRFPAKRSR